ncbi:MAG: sporulation protein [Mycolicibacterium sp.]|nr:sporulation protein [Mycolicibacterium sp.]
MEAQQILDQARDTLTVKRVFGEPYEKDGLTIVPTAKITGGLGTGEGGGRHGHEGTGVGFGLREKPAGAFVIKGEKVRWVPSVDVNRIILGGQLLAMVTVTAAMLRHARHSRRAD